MLKARHGRPQRTGWLVAALVAAAGLFADGPARAAPPPRELSWEQLIPAASRPAATPEGIIQHGQLAGPDRARARESFRARVAGTKPPLDRSEPPAPQPVSSEVVPELDGERVRLRGFAVPVAFDGAKVKEFLLVPYAGACIHVPPPPANQIVLIEAATPLDMDPSPFTVVTVTGTLRATALSTELASVGYLLTAERVEEASRK